MSNKINVEKTITYVAKNFTTGLTDVVLSVRKPDGTILTPAPTVTEQGDGIYTVSYTPDAIGNWQEKISSATNGDKVIRSYEVVNFDINTIQAQNVVIDGKVDAIDTKVDVVDGKVVVVDGKVDTVDGKVTVVDGKVVAVEILKKTG